jgi:hypothetical protein
MSMLLNSAEIRVHLAPGALLACEVRRSWGRLRVTRKAGFQCFPGERPAAMQALRDWIEEGPERRSLVWIVGPTEAQYFVLPWSPEWVDPRTRDAYARARYEQLYGRQAEAASFCFADPSPDGEQLVSCISATLHAELEGFARSCGCELQDILPSVAAVWERFREVLETEQGTLCIVEGDRQALVRHDRTRIEEIVVRRRGPHEHIDAGAPGVYRRFSAAPGRAPALGAAELRLPAQAGFDDSGDAAYAVALCGAL